MAIRKIEMRPPGSGDYADILYPKTSSDIVTSTDGTVQGDIDALKSGKSATGHTHVKANITDFPTLGTASSLNTGTGSGNIPVLDGNGKLNTSILPSLAITDTFVVATQVAMLALTAEVGDVAIRTDLSKSFILKTSGASTLANWQELLTPTDVVASVSGKTGIVTLVAGDVGLANVTNESKGTMLTSPALTGTPTAPTASVATNTTQIATTAYVKAQGYLTAISKANVEAVLTGVISTHSHSSGTPAAHQATHITGGTDIIPTFTSTASGLVPLSGGGTANYLRADGTFATPPDTNTVYTHPIGDGNNHIPSGGASNNFLKYSASGVAAWSNIVKANISDFPTIVSAFTNDAGYITKSVTIGAVQPSDGTLWYKEI